METSWVAIVKGVWKFMQESRPHSVNMASVERDLAKFRLDSSILRTIVVKQN